MVRIWRVGRCHRDHHHGPPSTHPAQPPQHGRERERATREERERERERQVVLQGSLGRSCFSRAPTWGANAPLGPAASGARGPHGPASAICGPHQPRARVAARAPRAVARRGRRRVRCIFYVVRRPCCAAPLFHPATSPSGSGARRRRRAGRAGQLRARTRTLLGGCAGRSARAGGRAPAMGGLCSGGGGGGSAAQQTFDVGVLDAAEKVAYHGELVVTPLELQLTRRTEVSARMRRAARGRAAAPRGVFPPAHGHEAASAASRAEPPRGAGRGPGTAASCWWWHAARGLRRATPCAGTRVWRMRAALWSVSLHRRPTMASCPARLPDLWPAALRRAPRGLGPARSQPGLCFPSFPSVCWFAQLG